MYPAYILKDCINLQPRKKNYLVVFKIFTYILLFLGRSLFILLQEGKQMSKFA